MWSDKVNFSVFARYDLHLACLHYSRSYKETSYIQICDDTDFSASLWRRVFDICRRWTVCINPHCSDNTGVVDRRTAETYVPSAERLCRRTKKTILSRNHYANRGKFTSTAELRMRRSQRRRRHHLDGVRYGAQCASAGEENSDARFRSHWRQSRDSSCSGATWISG